jgi:hypothetical protein
VSMAHRTLATHSEADVGRHAVRTPPTSDKPPKGLPLPPCLTYPSDLRYPSDDNVEDGGADVDLSMSLPSDPRLPPLLLMLLLLTAALAPIAAAVMADSEVAEEESALAPPIPCS